MSFVGGRLQGVWSLVLLSASVDFSVFLLGRSRFGGRSPFSTAQRCPLFWPRAIRLSAVDGRPQDMPYDVGPEVDSDSRDQAFLHVLLAGYDSDDSAQQKHLGNHDRW